MNQRLVVSSRESLRQNDRIFRIYKMHLVNPDNPVILSKTLFRLDPDREVADCDLLIGCDLGGFFAD